MVMTEDIESGRPVSAQFPLSAAWKNGEANQRTSLCALSGGGGHHQRAGKKKEQDAPERRTLDDDFDRSGELGLLRERLVDVDGLLLVGYAQLGNRIFRVCAFEVPRWRPSGRGAEYTRGGGMCFCWRAQSRGGVRRATRVARDEDVGRVGCHYESVETWLVWNRCQSASDQAGPCRSIIAARCQGRITVEMRGYISRVKSILAQLGVYTMHWRYSVVAITTDSDLKNKFSVNPGSNPGSAFLFRLHAHWSST